MKESDSAPEISVIVCTYNRADLLRASLQSLVEQSLEKDRYEVVIVDNGSIDHTSDVAEAFRSRHTEPEISLVSERRQGLGYARNTGLKSSRGDYLAFMDDDARADKNWLKLTLESFERVKPKPWVVGGPIYPYYYSHKPTWFRDSYEVRTWGDESRFLKRGESFSGSNMILEREIVEKCGGFDATVGMKGEYLSVGEETNLFRRIWQHSGNSRVLYYSPQLLMFHKVHRHKMTVSYRLKRAFATGNAQDKQQPESTLGQLRMVPRILASILIASVSAFWNKGRFPTYRNWMVEALSPIAMDVGRLFRHVGLSVPVRQRHT